MKRGNELHPCNTFLVLHGFNQKPHATLKQKHRIFYSGPKKHQVQN
jgi:hypothetical protein